MPRAKLTVSLPESLWIHEISTAYPDTTFRVSSVLPGSDVAIGVIELMAPNPVPILAAIDDRSDIRDLELLWKHDETALFTGRDVESVAARSHAAGRRSDGDPVRGCRRCSDVGADDQFGSVVNARQRVRRARHRVSHRLRPRRRREPPENPLTDRQLEVFRTALEAGYYDVPREATLTEVASARRDQVHL